jgi:hypothetical protein
LRALSTVTGRFPIDRRFPGARAPSALWRPSFPFTAAGQSRIHTGFPFNPVWQDCLAGADSRCGIPTSPTDVNWDVSPLARTPVHTLRVSWACSASSELVTGARSVRSGRKLRSVPGKDPTGTSRFLRRTLDPIDLRRARRTCSPRSNSRTSYSRKRLCMSNFPLHRAWSSPGAHHSRHRRWDFPRPRGEQRSPVSRRQHYLHPHWVNGRSPASCQRRRHYRRCPRSCRDSWSPPSRRGRPPRCLRLHRESMGVASPAFEPHATRIPTSGAKGSVRGSIMRLTPESIACADRVRTRMRASEPAKQIRFVQ